MDKAKADAAAAVGGGLFVTPTPSALQEKLKKVQEENQRLQNKVLRLDQEPARDQDLEERYNKLLEVMTACSFCDMTSQSMSRWKTDH